MKPRLEIEVITLFPKLFSSYCEESIPKRAIAKGLVRVKAHQLRDYSEDRHRKCDDKPYGGGPGMVMTPGPIFQAVQKIRGKKKWPIYLLDPHGKPFDQRKARKLAKKRHWMLLCGHYEGVDERVKKLLVDEEISMGDFVLTGGEIPALAVIDSAIRLVPGVLGNIDSLQNESFEENLLDYPHYTRPRVFRGLRVPDVLVSGHHREVALWRKALRLEVTQKKRPDIYKNKK